MILGADAKKPLRNRESEFRETMTCAYDVTDVAKSNARADWVARYIFWKTSECVRRGRTLTRTLEAVAAAKGCA